MEVARRSKIVFRILFILCISSFLLVLLTGYSYWREKQQKMTNAKNHARQEAVDAVQEIDTQLRKIKDTTTSIANDLTSGKLKDEQLINKLRTTIEQNPKFWQLGVAYVPYAYAPNIRLYAPVYRQREGQIKLDRVELSYSNSK